jgi:hypothetical protein
MPHKHTHTHTQEHTHTHKHHTTTACNRNHDSRPKNPLWNFYFLQPTQNCKQTKKMPAAGAPPTEGEAAADRHRRQRLQRGALRALRANLQRARLNGRAYAHLYRRLVGRTLRAWHGAAFGNCGACILGGGGVLGFRSRQIGMFLRSFGCVGSSSRRYAGCRFYFCRLDDADPHNFGQTKKMHYFVGDGQHRTPSTCGGS